MALWPKTKTALVIANRTKSRFFSGSSLRELKFQESMENPEGRLKDSEIQSDKPGREFESFNHETRHAFEAPTSPSDKVSQSFSKEVADFLHRKIHSEHLEQLFIIAEPQFLGLLRKELSPSTQKVLKASYPKDLIPLRVDQQWSHAQDLIHS